MGVPHKTYMSHGSHGKREEECTVKLSSYGCRFIGQRGGRWGGGAAHNDLQIEVLKSFVMDLIRFSKLGVGSDGRGVKDRSLL